MYIIERSEDTKCFQQKNIFPGEEKWEQIKEHIATFIQTRKYMYNGGWAIHHFLKSLNIGLQIYDENDICDSTDFDMFGPSPVEDLIKLGESMKAKFPDMTFTVNNGMHPNQYTIIINFLGVKLVDWIYISPNVYKYVPTITYDNGITCLHPRVELLRQYNMLSNIYLMAPDKDFNKAMKRIDLLEKYAMIPWMKENDMWDARKLKGALHSKAKEEQQPLQSHLLTKWLKTQKYVAKVGEASFNAMYDMDTKGSQLEFVVHDAVYNKVLSNLIQEIKGMCKEMDIKFRDVKVDQYETFIGVIGPLYNGWVDFTLDKVLICRLYSLATPVHMYDVEGKVCSYFFNMAHMMWRSLYLQYMKKEDDAKFYDTMVSYAFKKHFNEPKHRMYILNMKKESTLGVVPSRNFYMVSNLLRKQGIGFFRYMIDGVSEKKNKDKIKRSDFYYKEYEGKSTFKTTLDKIQGNKMNELSYLYERMKSSVNDNKKVPKKNGKDKTKQDQ
jgi:hypothetical protein